MENKNMAGQVDRNQENIENQNGGEQVNVFDLLLYI